MFKKLLSMFTSSPAKKQKPKPKPKPTTSKSKTSASPAKPKPKVAPTRIGELGEHKINIQLDQLPKGCRYLSDIMVVNTKSRTGYSQIDHVVLTPRGLFVIETKNYNGEIKGKRNDQSWTVSNRYRMYNPLKQNYGHIQAIKSYLPSYSDIRYISLVSFTMRCRFSVDPELRQIQSDELIVYDVELSEFIGRKMNRIQAEQPDSILSDADILKIYDSLLEANITDPSVRAKHVEKASTVNKSK
ncbi:nuclease-related domain-containing protein [Paenibacillus sp. CMAA1364]